MSGRPDARVQAATGRPAGDPPAGDPPAGDRCSAPFRVRFDEAGPDGHLRTSVVLRYAQDLAWYHSAQRGFERGWYETHGLAWLVRAAEVGIVAPVGVGRELTGTTQVVGWRRVWARRRTEFTDERGLLVAWTHIDWVLLDARGAPTRIPPEFAVFGAAAASFPLARVELDTPPSTADRATFTVRPQELDPMDHANNAVYADWLEERVIGAGGPEGVAAVRALPRLARLEYARPADRDATVIATTWADAVGSGWSCRFDAADGTALLRSRLQGA